MLPGLVAIGGGILGSILGGNAQKKAASTAADAQAQAAQLGVDEQSRQFDQLQRLMSPYVQGGAGAFGSMLSLMGQNGASAQGNAIDAIRNGAEYGALVDEGQNALLQTASATGGLRGGNTQEALAQLNPAILSGLIDKQFSRLMGTAQVGQSSAAGVGSAGIQTGQGIAGLYGQQGAASAGAALATGQANANMFSDFAKGIGGVAGLSEDNTFGKGVFF